MWVQHRVKRIKSKWKHFSSYVKTLSKANTIQRQTKWVGCKQPLLLLYGFGATRRSLKILETRLRQDNFDVFSINLGGFLELFNTDPIDEAAKKVAQKIEGLCKRYSIPRISVIGYSKGGLIGRYYVNLLGGNKRVHTLITLATPHQGNPWALLTNVLGVGLLSKGLRQMLPRSRLLKKLNNTSPPEDVYMASIASHEDRNCPAKYCRLPHTDNGRPIYNVILSHLSHSDFVLKQSAYQEILKHLKSGLTFASQNGAEDGRQSPQTSTK